MRLSLTLPLFAFAAALVLPPPASADWHKPSHGGRSAIAARMPCSTPGGNGSGRHASLPTSARKPSANALGSRGPCSKCSASRSTRSSTTGLPRATPNVGGSLTASERTRSGYAAATSSAITPP